MLPAQSNEPTAKDLLKLVRKRLAVEIKQNLAPFVKLLSRLLNTQDHEVSLVRYSHHLDLSSFFFKSYHRLCIATHSNFARATYQSRECDTF